jgi:hypothetical protein
LQRLRWDNAALLEHARELVADHGYAEAAASLSKRLGRKVSRSMIESALSRAGIRAEQKAAPLPARLPEDPRLLAWQQKIRKYEPEQKLPAAKVKGGAIERRITIGDVHAPHQDRLVQSVTVGVIREFRPHKLRQLGDLIDAEALSKYGRQRFDAASWAAEVYAANLYLDALQNAAPSAALDVLGGNHDDPIDGRPGHFAAQSDGLRGLFNTAEQLYLAPSEYSRGAQLRGGRYVAMELQPLIDGPAAYFHGVGFESVHFAHRIAHSYMPAHCPGKTLFGGHMHKLASSTGPCGTYQCVGWVGDRKAPAFRYATRVAGGLDWRTAIVLEEIEGDHLTYTVVEIKNGRAHFHGRVVASRAGAAA